MNQYIKIYPLLNWKSKQNYWIIVFVLNGKSHREKAPSGLDSDGNWSWFIHDRHQKTGYNFDWSKS